MLFRKRNMEANERRVAELREFFYCFLAMSTEALVSEGERDLLRPHSVANDHNDILGSQ
jgi:hypothetical protein